MLDAFRSTLRTLRQPRYAALSALMVLVALVCVGAGTWQIARFEFKVHANDQLRANAAAAPVPVTTLLPRVGHGTPGTDAVQFRSVTATGRYEATAQSLVRGRSVDGVQGFLVLTPLRTSAGPDVLVVRGFVGADADGNPPAAVAAPPSGIVTLTGRAQPGETPNDAAASMPPGQVHSINPVDQAARLGAPVLDGFVQLDQGAPGQRGLVAIPPPNLSNPAGGAVEPQHFAYIIQWYLFALLALAAPFAMVRADRREARRHGVDDENTPAPATSGPEPEPEAVPVPAAPDETPTETPLDEAERRARKLADRYSRG